MIIKVVESPGQLFAETVLYLHRREATCPPDKRRKLTQVRSEDAALLGKSILIVDDNERKSLLCQAPSKPKE